MFIKIPLETFFYIILIFISIKGNSTVISKSYTLYTNDFIDFKIFLNKKYQLMLMDLDRNGSADQLIIDSPDLSILLNNNDIQITKYFKNYKSMFYFSKSKKGKFLLNKIIKKKLLLQFLVRDGVEKSSCANKISSENLVSQADKVSYFIQDDLLNKINFESCNSNMRKTIVDEIISITTTYTSNSNKLRILRDCIDEVSNKIDIPINLFQTIITKIESISSGLIDLKIICQNESDTICSNRKYGASLAYPDTIWICNNNIKDSDLSKNIFKEILQHELYHSKKIELNDSQINSMELCQERVRSPFKSKKVLEESINNISEQEVESIDFSPAREISTFNVPPPPQKPTQLVLNKELNPHAETTLPSSESLARNPNNTSNSSPIIQYAERVSPSNPIIKYAEETNSWAKNAMNIIVPQVFAEDPNNGDVKFKESLAKSTQPRSPSEPFNTKTPTQEILANKGFKYEPKRTTFDDNPSTALTKVIEKSNSVTSHQSNDIITPATPNIATSPINKASTNGKSSDTGRNGNLDITGSTTAPSRSNQSHRIANSLQSNNGTNQPNRVPNTLLHTSTSDDLFGYLRNRPLAKDVRVKLRDPYFRQFINQQKITFYFKDKDGKLVNFKKNDSESKIHFVENKQGRFDEVSIKNLHQIVNYNE